jgi:hypothetical protein
MAEERGVRGEGLESGQPTASAVGGREEVGAPAEGASQEAASSCGAGCSGPEQPTLPEQPTSKPKKPRKRAVRLDKADRAVRDPMIYQQVRGEMRSVRSVAKMWKISAARVSQIVSDENRKIANSPQLFDLAKRQEGQRQSEAEFKMRGEQDLMFSRMKMQAATKPLVTRKTGHRGEIEYEETITREQKSEQLFWFREVRKLETQLRDHAARPVSPPPPDADKSPWHPWECEAEAHAANWVQLVCQGILTRDDYDIWCARHAVWCQLTYPSFSDMVDKMLKKAPCMLWGLTPEKAMRMGTKIPGLERFADLAKAWIRDGGKLKDDWETPPPPEEDISPLPTWTLRTVDVSGRGSFVVCDSAEAEAVERREGLGARGESGELAQSSQPTPSAVGEREEVARRVPSYEKPVQSRGPSSQEAPSSRGAGCSGPEQPTLGSGPSQATASEPEQPTLPEQAPWNDTPPYPGMEVDAQESWGPEWEVSISVNEKRRLTRESWDYLLEQQWVTPEEYAVYRARDAREFGEDLAPAGGAEGRKALSNSAADSGGGVQDNMPLKSGCEKDEGLGARGERGQPTQSGQPTPSAVGGCEEVEALVEAVGETAASRGAEPGAARRSAAMPKAASSSGAGCSGPEQPTLRRSEQPTLGPKPGQTPLRRRDRPPRNRREQIFAEKRERSRERRRQEEEKRRAAETERRVAADAEAEIIRPGGRG